MVINAQGELESENEEEVDDDDMPSLEDANNEQNALVGDLLVARRFLNVQCHYKWRELHKLCQHLFGG
jgi:hypothetical protein